MRVRAEGHVEGGPDAAEPAVEVGAESASDSAIGDSRPEAEGEAEPEAALVLTSSMNLLGPPANMPKSTGLLRRFVMSNPFLMFGKTQYDEKSI